MKNKKFIVIFIIFLILFFPLGQSYASLFDFLLNPGAETAKFLAQAISFIIRQLTKGIHTILNGINQIVASIIDRLSVLDPFENPQGTQQNPNPPAEVLWFVFKNFAYILLVFSALAAGYEWILGEESAAKKLIFNIIIVALIINFSFLLVKESFNIVRQIEIGLQGGGYGVIGTMIYASFWQEDPFKLIPQIVGNIQNEIEKSLLETIGYIGIIIFDMLLFIILSIFGALYAVRFVMLMFLIATSSIAFASLTFPQFKGTLGEIMSGFKVFGTWFGAFIRWLLVIPIFAMFVIWGNILKANVLSGATTAARVTWTEFFQFVLLFFVLGGWYIVSMIVANKISKGVSGFAKGLATAFLLALGGIAAKGLITTTQGTVGGILSKVGGGLQEKIGTGGLFGIRSWIGQKIGKPIKEAGEKMIERRYGLEAESVKETIGRIDEQLRKETDPNKIQNLTSQLSQVIQKYKGNNYVLKSINESIKKISPYSTSKILASAENLKAFASPDVPQETREAVIIGLVDKLRKGDLKKMAGDTGWLGALREISPDVGNAFLDKMNKEFKETDGLEIISKGDVRDFVSTLEKDDNLRKTLNNITKGFVDSLLEKNIENISNAMTSWDKDIWKPENTEKINNILRSQLSEDEIKASILETIKKTENRSAIIRGALKESSDGLLRTTLGRLTDKEREELKKLLTPQDQATLEAIRVIIT
jgi:hypothetical protein